MPVPPSRPGVSPFTAVTIAAAMCLALSACEVAGDPPVEIKINEVESDGLADFIELVNTSATPTDVTGFVLKDNDDSRTLTIPNNTVIPAGGFLAVDTNVAGGFGLESSDSARVFLPNGFTEIDSFTWTSHATTTYGRCPDGIGAFIITNAATKGAANACPPIGRSGWSASTAVRGDFDGDGFGDLAIGVSENSGQGAVHILRGSATGITTAGSQFWSQNSIGIADTAENGDDFGRSLAVGNFNGDGFADLAIGTPGENAGAGAVHVLYGSASGLTATGSEFWTQASTAVGDEPEPGDHFGATLASGNVNSSTVATELVIGAPDEDIGAATDAGIVQILNGTASGLTGAGSQIWSQNSVGVADTAEAGDRFGSSLAMGNLGGSGLVDLAVGVPEEDIGAVKDAGIVHVLLGSPTGLTATGSSLWSQNSTSIADNAEAGDGFGASLAIGNVCGTNVEDLIVGIPGENIGAADNAGMVQTISGGASGPTGTGSRTFSQATVGIADAPETGDQFGYAVAVGDFGGDPYLDLAVGAPGEGSGTLPQFGVVHVIPGSTSGPTATGSQLWSQDSVGVADSAEANDRFGAALTTSNFGNTSDADLAIGVPGESVGAAGSAGIVQVFPGSAAFLTSTGSKTFSQNTAGVADDAEASDAMGIALGR